MDYFGPPPSKLSAYYYPHRYAGTGAYEAEVARSAFNNLAYPMDDYFVGADWSWPVAALDKYGHQLGQGIDAALHNLGQAAQTYTQQLGQGISSAIPSPDLKSLGLGNVADRASSAADATREAAAAAKRAAEQHEETMKVAKYVAIGLGVLGGAALVYYLAK
jgi:hypothetical protein